MQYTLVKEKLKSALKENGITYAELGAQIGLTESGIKKMFLASDISLTRLSQVAEVLGLELEEIFRDEQELTSTELSRRAEEFFEKNPKCFEFYFLLLSESMNLADILKSFNFDKKTAYRYLRELERLKLIKWLKDDKIRPQGKAPVLFKSSGTFMKKITRRWCSAILEDALQAETDSDDHQYSARLLHLRPETNRELKNALIELVNEFNRRSLREKKFYRAKVKPVRVMVCATNGHIIKAN